MESTELNYNGKCKETTNILNHAFVLCINQLRINRSLQQSLGKDEPLSQNRASTAPATACNNYVQQNNTYY
jgi:hypothetical protein